MLRLILFKKKLDIIKFALDLFIENGYEKTKISHIMVASHLSKDGMYHYFSSKEEILDEVIHYAISQELANFSELLDSAKTVYDKREIYLDNNPLNASAFSKKFNQFKHHDENPLVSRRYP